jgi:photosystem II stability/assembly factor-like uncharacterized protein
MLKLNQYKLFFIIPLIIFLTSGCITVKTSKETTTQGIGYGGIFKTANKGTNWIMKSAIATASSKPQSISGLNVSALVMDPGDNMALYFGSEGNGLFYSYDGAETWQYAKGLGQGIITAIAIDPMDKCTIYVSMGNKILKSIDCNRTWQQAYIDNDSKTIISALAIDFYDSRIVYAGLSRGDLIKSSDGGGSWQTIVRLKGQIKKLVLDPNDSRNIYIITDKQGLFRLADNGENWKDLDKTLTDLKLGKVIKDFIIASSSDGIMFLATDKGIIKSANKGATWEQLKLIPPEKSAAIRDFTINSKDINEIYYVTNTTFYRSIDGGVNWTTIKIPTVRQGTELLIDPINPNIIYMGVWAPPQK